ncbi:MAG: FkbM family methyltransferase [Sporichthyaceae bacterium]
MHTPLTRTRRGAFIHSRPATPLRALLRTIRDVPPGLLRAIPLRRLRVFLLEVLDLSLRLHPKQFQVRCTDGQLMTGNTSDLIQRYLYLFGVWEPALTTWLRENLTPGATVVDVGANIGYFTTLSASLVGPSGNVVAVECLPSVSDRLAHHVRLNSLANVSIHKCAASDAIGSTNVYRADSDNIGKSSTFGDGELEATVETRPLDDILAAHDPATIGLVKIDVEGDELRVLRGARRTLAGLPSGAAVLVEVLPEMLQRRGDDASGLLEVFPPDQFVPMVMDNQYSVAYYAKTRIPAPRAWSGSLTEPADMIFIKR